MTKGGKEMAFREDKRYHINKIWIQCWFNARIVFYVKTDHGIRMSAYIIVVEKFHTVFVSDFHHLSHVTLIFDQIHDTLSYGFGSTSTKQNNKKFSMINDQKLGPPGHLSW